METAKASGEGIVVQIGLHAMERIEVAAMAGIRQELSTRLDKVISDTVADIVESKISEVIGSLAEKAVMEYLTKPRQPTNQWGEPVGGTPMALSDQIPKKVAEWLEEKVDREGKRAGYGDRSQTQRLDFIVGKFVRDELDVATKQAAAKVTEEAKRVVAAHVGRFVAEQMIPQIEVGR